MNSVTHEPISRALVSSPDNHFATMTDSQGHFELKLAKNTTGDKGSNRPTALVARKPGFLSEPAQDLQLDTTAKELSLSLAPEALIVGHVALGSAEAADKIQIEIYRRKVEDGRGHWIPSGQTTTRSNGEFRFAELAAGTYKLMTHEQLDRDQPVIAPGGGQLYGYAPVYFPRATDFAAADNIFLSAGQTFQADLVVVRQPYYPVKILVVNAAVDSGIAVSISAAGSHGPGYTLGYNPQTQSIVGLLPQGLYSVEALSYGTMLTAGETPLTVRNVPLATASMTMVPARSVHVNVKEEFTAPEPADNAESNLRGPARYLNVRLEPADDFSSQNVINLQPPSRQNDQSLVLEGASPGRYWVHLDTSRGYAASVIAGGIDLLREPLVIANTSAIPSIEITMRDDSAHIEGTVEGADPALTAGNILAASFVGINPPGAHTPFAHVYFVPLPESPGRFSEVVAGPDGTFTSPELPPGAYRVLAFKHPQTNIEYQNPDAIRVYEAKGQVVHLTGDQKEHLALQLIPKSE